MAVNLSPIWGAGAQLLDNSGNVLTGGKIYTYLAGTTTPATTYTSSNGNTANSNPIILNSAGRVPYEIWLTDSIEYKFVLKDSNDTLIGTWDNLVGINSNFINYYGQQEIQTATAGQTVFTLTEFEYEPNTGNLSVFVDGVNQYGPGAQYAFIETDSTTVTFVSGLHLGASVKFTTTKLENPGVADASQVSYTYPDANAVPESVEERLAQYVSVKDFGAVGDGVTDDYNAWNNAVTYCAANKLQLYAPSTNAYYKIGTNLYINCAFSAGIYHVFGGSGTITFNTQYNQVGYPEWWGAVTNTGADSTSAILASFAALPITQLQAADYYVATTLKLNVAGRTLRGSGCFYNGVAGDSTRVISLTGSNNVIQMGPDTQPASINLFTGGMVVENLEVSRAAAPVISSGCAGILNRWTLYTQIRDVKSVESIAGFHYIGTVASYTQNCWAFRSSAGTGAGTDYWYGFYIDGQTVLTGASGGNASIYFMNTNSNNVASLGVQSSGYYVDGSWADTSITNPECTGCAVGINIQGNSSHTLNYGETDFNIVKPIIDAFTVAGIFINNTSEYGTISIIGGFAAPYGSGTPTGGIYLNNSLSSVSITDFQHILGPNASITGGLVAINSKNISSIGNSYVECAGVSVSLSSVTNSLFMDKAINNGTTGLAVLQASNCSRNKFEMMCSGGSAKFGLGYQGLSTGNTYNEFNCTGLDSTTINGGSANKLNVNTVQITTNGTFGTGNYASGVMG